MDLNTIKNIDYWGNSASRINENFSKTKVEIEKLKYFSKNPFVGYFDTEVNLPARTEPAWALVGDLSSAKPYAYYVGDGDSSSPEETQDVPKTIEQGTWSERNGSKCSDEAYPNNSLRLRTDDAIVLVRGTRYVINVNSGYVAFVIFFSNFVTNEIDSHSNTVGEYKDYARTHDFNAIYSHMAVIIKRENNSAIAPSDNHGLTITHYTEGSASGWTDLSAVLGTYDFTNLELPTLAFPTAFAGSFDDAKNMAKGTMRLKGNRLVISKDASFYLYLHGMGGKSIKTYQFNNETNSDIKVDMAKGDTVCIDLSVSQVYPASNALTVGGTIKKIQYGGFNALQIPVCQRRTAHVTVNPAFLWMLYYDKIAGASQNDVGIIGADGTAQIKDGTLTVTRGTSLFLYRNTGLSSAAYLRINAVEPYFFDFKKQRYGTLVIDGSRLEWMNDSTSVNDLSQITRIVAGGEYSVDDIPIAHVRDGRIFVWPTFQSIFSYMDVGGMNEVYDINRAEFFPAYYSVCRGKRDSNTVSARWVQRCNILHISDNHATNEDGYSDLREAISIANARNMMLDAIVNTGDLTNGFGTGVPKNTVIETLNKVRDIMLASNMPALALLGNHDANDYGGDIATALTKKEQWEAIFEGLSGKWRNVIFGSTSYASPQDVPKTVEAGTWRETYGHRPSESSLPGYSGIRLRTNNAIELSPGNRYTISVNNGYQVFLILFSKFVSNELDYMGNTVKTFFNYAASFDFIANDDEVAMAIVIKKTDGSAISVNDAHGLIITCYAMDNSPSANNYRHNSYYDMEGDDYGRIRIIMLDQLDHGMQTSDGTLVYTCQNDPVYSQEQIDWLCDTALQVPDGTGIIICNHYPFDFTPTTDATQSLIIDGDYVQGWNMIPDIVRAWQERTTLNKNYNDKVGSQHISVNVDFSNIGSGCEFITYLCGHTHYKTYKQVEGYNQMMLLEDSSGSYGTVYSEVARMAGTPTSNAFSIISIDRVQGMIYRTSYGAYKTVDECGKERIEKISYRISE